MMTKEIPVLYRDGWICETVGKAKVNANSSQEYIVITPKIEGACLGLKLEYKNEQIQ